MTKHIAIVYPAGKIKISEEQKREKISTLEALGFTVSDVKPELDSLDGCTSSPVLERATQLSFALTARKFHVLMAARGGVGTTELIPYLENLLPPVIADKTFVGFSDNSFLGVYLALRFPNLRYIHGQMAFSNNVSGEPEMDKRALVELLNDKPTTHVFPCDFLGTEHVVHGVCVPLNLSLAESVAAFRYLNFPENTILFVEECNEHLYRIIRKLDSIINSGLIQNVKAIVVGSFSDCLDSKEKPLDRKLLLKIFARKTKLPIYDLPIFGHDAFRFPLLMNGKIVIEHKGQKAQISITNKQEKSTAVATHFTPDLFCAKNNLKKIHLTGIGGTGMAQVAGLLLADGYQVTGSDNPIYPPMDKLIAHLGIKPDVGFRAENITKNKPDAIVLANVVSRTSAALKKNDELEEILAGNTPVLSFPSLLRRYFLHSSRNIVISGTHGKTTTSSIVTFLLTSLGLNPSYLIGGAPANFKTGFALNSKELFVLEGDEYDSAFFDKGPKFLHYEPKIALLNNIEFDHADIYQNVEAIEQEFLRLAKLCKDRNGIVVANLDDKRVCEVVTKSQAHVIGFAHIKNKKKHKFDCWYLKDYKTEFSGIQVTMIAPNGSEFEFKTGVFGAHNALNSVAAMATLHANQILETQDEKDFSFLKKALKAMWEFRGVKRRFELLMEKNNISVFDDFAHHPTAISTTLEAFRDYMTSSGKIGKLIVCFDPRNATMRRNVLADELSKSFAHADVVFLGKVPQDLRMDQNQSLDGYAVAKACGSNARYFEDNIKLIEVLRQTVLPGDTVVFMSSGSFDGISHKFAESL